MTYNVILGQMTLSTIKTVVATYLIVM